MRTGVLACALIFAAGATLAAPEGPAKKRVAVFDFANAAVQGGMSMPFFESNPPNIGKAVADMLVTKLVKNGLVTVIERTALDKLLAEQNLTNSDRTDPTTAAKLGRILGVDAIILGTITHYDFEDKTTGGGGGGFAGFGRGSMSTKHDIKAKVQISARLVSPDTAEVVTVSEGIGETLRKGVKVDYRDMGQMGAIMGGQANNPIMNEVMDKAIIQLASQIEQNIPKIPPRTFVIDGVVADSNESGRLVLNVGAQHGVKIGDRLHVHRAGKEIRDPVSGKVLLREDVLLGEALVTTVNDISSIAAYKGTEAVKVGDLVRNAPKQ
jgi:curli biogenesis system outer membrane secretion channel CsgG